MVALECAAPSVTCELQREISTDDTTLGRLFVNGAFQCFTLEPSEDRPQHPAIPPGTYSVIINRSSRFGRLLPLIVGVPGRFGIRIHPGNSEHDTEGCILLGMARAGVSLVARSREACDLFQSKLAFALASGEPVTLHVMDAPKVLEAKA